MASRKKKTVADFNGWKTYKRLLKYALPFWLAFFIAIIANIVYSSIDAWLVHFLQPLLNKGFIAQDVVFIKWLPVIVIGVFVIRAGSSICSNFFMTYVARSIIMVFRQHIFSHYQKMPAKVYDKSNSGHLLSAIIFNVEQVANAGTDALTTFLQSIVLVIGLLAVMFNISWKLTLIYFATIPVMLGVMYVVNKRMRRLSFYIQESMGNITATAEENIDGYKVVRTFGGQDYESNRFDKAVKTNRTRELKIAITKALSSSITQMIAAVALAIIITVATSNTMENLSAGAFTSLVAAMLAILKPLKDLSNVNGKIQRGLAAAHTIFSVLDSPEEVDDGEVVKKTVDGSMSIKNLSFAYDKQHGEVLKKINLEIKAGEIIALVGRSGSGKSSLANLLMRFYDYDQGEIMLDGDDILNYKLKDYREHFAYVSQQVVLFNDTVANNIAYGVARDRVTKEDIVAAAKTAHADVFIDKMEKGFDSIVGDDGVLLSGGQRQRIALARAILKKSPILVLDEATSALDTESERYIQDALDKLMHQCTTIVIAHRLSTIKEADKIVVMDNGEIVEVGKHEELLTKQGHYARLHDMHFKDGQ